MQKCLLPQAVAETFDLYDHCYLYVDINSRGSHHFRIISEFGDNPLVLGFFVEQSCLAQIAHSGVYVGKAMVKPDKTILFDENFPLYDSSRAVTFYIPKKFNFKAIDGLLLKTF